MKNYQQQMFLESETALMAKGSATEQPTQASAVAPAVQVTTLFGDSVLGVTHLVDPTLGRVRPLTIGLLILGWGTFLVGLSLGIAGQLGLASLMLLSGLSLGVFSSIRAGEEKASPHFTLGEGGEVNVPLPGATLPVGRFPLVHASGSGYSLLFTEEMSGDVTHGVERKELSALVAEGRARPAPGMPRTYVYPITGAARIKVDLGQNTFLVDSAARPRPIKSPLLSRWDWQTQSANMLSFGTHAVVLFLVFLVPPSWNILSTDRFNTDNRQVKMLIKPPEAEVDERAWLEKKRAEAGGGQKTKGPEGKMGTPEVNKKARGRVAIKGPRDNPSPMFARRIAEDTARKAGVLGMLASNSSSSLTHLFGRDGALGNEAIDAMGGLLGNDPGPSYGIGGLGIIGTGRSGGGTEEGISFGTLNTRRGPGFGAGPGGIGRGWKDKLPPRKPGEGPKATMGPPVVEGGLDRAIIRRVVRQHLNQVKFCYQKELTAHPDLYGRAVVKFTIMPTGQVMSATMKESSLGNAKVEQCLTQTVRRWLFPKPNGRGIVVVSYPFVFKAAAQ